MAVNLAEAFVDADALTDDDGVLHPTGSTERFFAQRGVDVSATRGTERTLVRSCLDWTARRPHLAGRLGALLLQHLLDKGAVTRKAGTRAVQLNQGGSAYLSGTFGVDVSGGFSA